MASHSPPRDPIDAIVALNRGRDPHLLVRKFQAMAADRFAFLRASAGLAHVELDLTALPFSPTAWLCGDLHLNNFGCFRGLNRLVYFDLNDFDEAARLPIAFDLLRFLGSILTAAPGFGLIREEAETLAAEALVRYCEAMARGKAFWLEPETARGPIQALLEQVSTRRRRDLLERRTELRRGRRRLLIDNQRILPLPPDGDLREQLAEALRSLGHLYESAEFFLPRDFARRVAGMGSLGVPRYVALVRGRGDPDRNALIDFKLAAPSSASAALSGLPQGPWADEAQRVVTVQDICQAACPAYLTAMPIGGRPFVVRELQPVEDRVALERLARQPKRLADTVGTMAEVAAYAQLRGAGRMGTASPEALIEFGFEVMAQPRPWLDAARQVDSKNAQAHRAFRTAWHQRDPRLLALCKVEASPPKPAPRKK
ncbi:MAG TPA: DUF2252 family protein [Burkholderiaceae bacterium]|jgi:uncharacterized protein (DUF2252 family)|nr:DUF2252 family protein [Burkholderiaceae bacterium]